MSGINLRPNYFIRVLDAVSQLINAIFLGGDANESVSGRCYREGWTWAEAVIDTVALWEDSHCRNAYLSDIARAYALIEENK